MPMARLATYSPTVAHNYMLLKLLPILEAYVPCRSQSKKRSRTHRRQKLLWRKIRKVKLKMAKAQSSKKLTRLIQKKVNLEKELKSLYAEMTRLTEDRVVGEMRFNPKSFFTYAKARLKSKTNVGPFIDPDSGELVLDADYTAECLGAQYSSVFNPPRPEWAISNMKEFFSAGSTSGATLTDFEFTEEDIELACNELSLTSAPGPDGVPSSLLKICRKELKKPLFLLWSSSMRKGIIPPDLLLVLICPIHKGGSKTEPGQYRPVALTSHITKVFERVVRKVLVSHLEYYGYIPNEQHGFRSARSTLTQLLSHWDGVLDHLENGDSVDVIYTDFSKAFDKCETNVLLHSLRDCGISGKLGQWIAAFLDPKARRQTVGVEGRLSSLAPVISGVPQGTVLGPILFLIHIRGISSGLSAQTSSSSFADDTRIWRGVSTHSDCESLQYDMNEVYAWADQVNMQFNSKKFEHVRYCVDESSAPDFKYLAPDMSEIERADSVRDLGVILSSSLSFSLQVDKVVSTASQMVGWAMRTFRGRSPSLMLTIFKSLVQPHLDYCGQLWSPSKQEDINKIENVQKSMLNRIWDARLQECSYWDRLKSLQMFSQERRRERYQIILVWKISQGLVSGYTMEFSNCANRTGRKAIPAAVNMRTTAVIRNARASTFAVKGAQLFNLMPLNLRNSNHGDIPMFKNHLDIYLWSIPDQPTTRGLARNAKTNSLLDQVPLYEANVTQQFG